MAAEESFHPAPPPDEAWWTRELHRNEKLVDKLMAALGEPPDWEKFPGGGELPDPADDPELEREVNALLDGKNPVEENDEPNQDDDLEVNMDYPHVSRLAREFACAVFDLDELPGHAELLYLSAGKVGANLAGGHSLGYDEEFLCGNIVKCRWALSDCEFCREMLEQFHAQTGQEIYATLAADSVRVAAIIRDRVARLRQRVWWQK